MKWKTYLLMEMNRLWEITDRGSVMVFLSFSPSPYGLIISPSTYGYNVTQLLI